MAADVAGVTVASIYVPNGGKDFPAKLRFLEALEGVRREMRRAAGREVVLCGDLNVARTDQDVHPKERKAGRDRPARRRARAVRADPRPTGSSTSAAPSIRTTTDLFTWWAPWRNLRQRNIGWRIDYILASESLARRATACAVRADVGTSDHAPVVADFGDP